MFPLALCYDELLCIMGQTLHSDTLDACQCVDPVWTLAALDSVPAQALRAYWIHNGYEYKLFEQGQWSVLEYIATTPRSQLRGFPKDCPATKMNLTPPLTWMRRDMFPSLWDLCCSGNIKGIRWLYKTYGPDTYKDANIALGGCCCEEKQESVECARWLCETYHFSTLSDLTRGGKDQLMYSLTYYNDYAVHWLVRRFGLPLEKVCLFPANPAKRRKITPLTES